jgi:hypothetical protein
MKLMNKNNHHQSINGRSIIVLILLFGSWGPLRAQWSNNPSQNLILCQEGTPTSAKIVYSNERYYITYFKYVDRIISLHLQILDFNGHPLLEGNGQIISNHPQKTTTLSELIVDLDGNIVVAFCDTRNDGYGDISLYKMDPSGKQLWGKDGINFFIPGTNDAGPKMAVNPDNSITVCFGSFEKLIKDPLMRICIYRISENGEVQWNGQPRIIMDEIYNLHPVGIMSLPDGGELLAYEMLSDFEDVRIKVKRIDINGSDYWVRDLWISDRCLYISVNVQTYSGSNGNFYLAWKANGCPTEPSVPYIQGVTPEGNILWPEPGVRISEDSTHNQYYPVIQGINSLGDVFVLWNSVNQQSSSWRNLNGQLVSPEGELKWGNNGIEIKKKFNPVFAYGSLIKDTALVIYTDPIFNIDMFQVIKAVSLDIKGNFTWPGEVVLNDLKTSKAVYGFTPIINGQGVIIYTEDDGILSGSRLAVQNIWKDGTIGLKTSSTDWNEQRSEIRIVYKPNEGFLVKGINDPFEIQLYNTLGQCLVRKAGIVGAGFNTVNFDTSSLKTGIYFVKILQQGDKVTCLKILIH